MPHSSTLFLVLYQLYASLSFVGVSFIPSFIPFLLSFVLYLFLPSFLSFVLEFFLSFVLPFFSSCLSFLPSAALCFCLSDLPFSPSSLKLNQGRNKKTRKKDEERIPRSPACTSSGCEPCKGKDAGVVINNRCRCTVRLRCSPHLFFFVCAVLEV